MKKLMIAVLAVFMAAAPSFADEVYDNASIIFPLLSMGVGGRALGMGNAFTAVADDASSVYWNAAGLSSVKTMQIGLTYDSWVADALFGQIQFAMPLSVGSIGADVIYMNSGDVMGRTDSGVETENISLFNVGVSVGYGIEIIKNLSAGAVVKVINLSSGTISSTGFAADVGAMFKTDMFSVGLNLQNLGTSTGNYSLPINVKAGVAVAAMKEKQHDLLFALDTQYSIKDDVSLSGGVEYTYDKVLTARLGYQTSFGTSDLEGVKGICGGIGVKYLNFTFDYALVPYGDLGLTQKATLSYSFGSAAKPAAKAKAVEPAKTAVPVVDEKVKTTTKVKTVK